MPALIGQAAGYEGNIGAFALELEGDLLAGFEQRQHIPRPAARLEPDELRPNRQLTLRRQGYVYELNGSLVNESALRGYKALGGEPTHRHLHLV
ncbi:hypothetical protein GCM10023184_33020 [Flaviaesturariibacter amylovorans]|uniref:Uncharacterized protein n=1 Tax=Flaviaesturariibacter amylovorans TaxID=1084520 RepID=A0ABP8HC37_9BACT